jgi:hypothetical protein
MVNIIPALSSRHKSAKARTALTKITSSPHHIHDLAELFSIGIIIPLYIDRGNQLPKWFALKIQV